MFGRQDKLLRRMLLRRPAPHDSSDIPPDAARRVAQVGHARWRQPDEGRQPARDGDAETPVFRYA